MNFPTVEQYQAAINNLSIKPKEVLQTLITFLEARATAKELAKALNYAGYQAINRQIGRNR